MASLRDIRKRIASVKNTQKITKAMKMVAAAKLRKSQEAVMQLRPYAKKLNGIMTNVSAGADLDLRLRDLVTIRVGIHQLFQRGFGVCVFVWHGQETSDWASSKHRPIFILTLS